MSSSVNDNLLSGQSITEKLTKHNHALWKAQVQSDVRGARLQGHLTIAAAAPDVELISKVDDKEVKTPGL